MTLLFACVRYGGSLAEYLDTGEDTVALLLLSFLVIFNELDSLKGPSRIDRTSYHYMVEKQIT
jgi:hypothetical protein